jgi:valyl-tRNA synthetase
LPARGEHINICQWLGVIAVLISEIHLMTVPENNASHVQDDHEDRHNKLSSLVDGTQEIQQSFGHSPVKDAKAAVLNKKTQSNRKHRRTKAALKEIISSSRMKTMSLAFGNHIKA